MQTRAIDWMKISGIGLLYIVYLFMLAGINIITVTTGGFVNTIFNTMYVVMLYLFYTISIFGIIALIWYFLDWISWSVKTPAWRKKQ